MRDRTHYEKQPRRHIREAFIEAIENHCWRVNICGQWYSIVWLTSRLWDCLETVPQFICDDLCIPQGSTYAQASRQLRSDNYRATPLPEVTPKPEYISLSSTMKKG